MLIINEKRSAKDRKYIKEQTEILELKNTVLEIFTEWAYYQNRDDKRKNVHEHESTSIEIIQYEEERKRLKKLKRPRECGQYKKCNILVIGVPDRKKREWEIKVFAKKQAESFPNLQKTCL